jgi:hypothetical protein
MTIPESGHRPADGARTNAEVGRSLPLSVPRRLICDLLAFAKAVPSVPVQRQMSIPNLAALRARLARTPDLPGWCAIFTKAFGIMASRFPELRRAYLPFPWPHLYEHPCSMASLAIERQYRGENAVFWGQVRAPERQSLRHIQAYLHRLKTAPIESIGLFRRALLVGRLPWPLRRLAWWIGLNSSGAKRAKRMGTFGVSVYSGLGAESLHPISPLTATLNYGIVQADGTVPVRLIYDHRVVDGATVARALLCLESVLNREIFAELEHESQAWAA